MSGDLDYTPTAPIGSRRGVAHHNYGYTEDGSLDPRTGYYEVDAPVYSAADVAFGARVREARAAAGLTLRTGAAALGLSVVELSALERGRARCDIDEAKRRFAQAALAGGAR